MGPVLSDSTNRGYKWPNYVEYIYLHHTHNNVWYTCNKTGNTKIHFEY